MDSFAPTTTSRILTSVLLRLGPWAPEQRPAAERVVQSMILRYAIEADDVLALDLARLTARLAVMDLSAMVVDLSGLDEVSRSILEELMYDLHQDPDARLLWAHAPTPASLRS